MAKVELYTTTYCPFCTRAKSLLKSKGIAFDEIDVTDDDALRAKMIEMSGGRRTVPEIFINGKIIGGFDELRALNDAGQARQSVGRIGAGLNSHSEDGSLLCKQERAHRGMISATRPPSIRKVSRAATGFRSATRPLSRSCDATASRSTDESYLIALAVTVICEPSAEVV